MHRLYELRQGRALSQEELGKLAGVTRHTVARLEAGTTRAQPRTVRALARALKVNVAVLADCAPPVRARQEPLPGLNGGAGGGA